MHNMDTIIGAAWLRSVDEVINRLNDKQKRKNIQKIDRSFADAIESFWDSAIDNQVDYSDMYHFAFSFFVRYYERLLDVKI